MMSSLHEQLKEGAMLLRGFATADASSLIEEAAFFEDLFLSNGRFDAGTHFYDNAVNRKLKRNGFEGDSPFRQFGFTRHVDRHDNLDDGNRSGPQLELTPLLSLL